MIPDFRFALRMIKAHRWFSAAVVATIALGIGLNTMVFTLVNAALFKPLDVQNGDRLVVVGHKHPSMHGKNDRDDISYPDFREYRAHSTSFDRLEAMDGMTGTLSEHGNPPQSFNMGLVSAGMFEMLHMQPILGRGFSAADDKPGAEAVLLLGYGVWKDRYGSDSKIAGRSVRMNGKPATIIGVMPEAFKFPDNKDMWTTIVPTPDIEKRSAREYELYGILKPGVTIPQATADLDVSVQRMSAAYPDTNKDLAAVVQTFHERFNGGPIRLVFLLMQSAVIFVLLIACANVANMMLSRALERRREISIRAAMGASRWQIVRQLLMECTLLSVLGGAVGFALAAYGVHWFDLQSRDVGKPYWVTFNMDYRVFTVFAVLCVASGVIFGLVPALRASRVDLNASLKEGTRSLGMGRGAKLSTALVIFQFASTLVLLTGAGMFVRGMLDQQSVNRVVPAEQLLMGHVSLPALTYADDASRVRFFDQLMPRLQAIPGVTQVALASAPPAMGGGERHIEIEGQPHTDFLQNPTASMVVTSPGYFRAIDLPLVAGRAFSENDGDTTRGGQRSAIVSKALADRFWPRQEAIGKRVRFKTNDVYVDWVTVIGVTANIVQHTDKVGDEPVIFLPYRQEVYRSMMLVVRASGPTSIASATRAAVGSIDPDLPLNDVRTLNAAIARQLWFLKLFAKLFTSFGLIALVIAAVGIYAVIAQATARRTQEIGVRMALGATAGNILTLILSRGALQLAAGLALGLLAAFPAARVLSGLPLRMTATDPVVFSSVSLLLTLVGLFACWIPARRAAALEPTAALRDE